MSRLKGQTIMWRCQQQVWCKTRVSHHWSRLENKRLPESGSASYSLHGVSCMSSKVSYTVWLDLWAERSICGSLLPQERGEDLTRSETYLYTEVWEPRQDAGAPCKSGYMDLETFSSGFILESMAKWLKRHFDHWRYPEHYSWKSNFSHGELGRRGKEKTIGKEAKLLTHFVATRVSNPLWRLGSWARELAKETETSRCSFASTVIHDAHKDVHVFRILTPNSINI